jgi:hypothetical protein
MQEMWMMYGMYMTKSWIWQQFFGKNPSQQLSEKCQGSDLANRLITSPRVDRL